MQLPTLLLCQKGACLVSAAAPTAYPVLPLLGLSAYLPALASASACPQVEAMLGIKRKGSESMPPPPPKSARR